MTVEANIDELARLLAELEKRHPLDPTWSELRAQVQRMHADIEARIDAEILSAVEEFRNASAALEPADRHRIMSEFQKAYPGLGDLIHQPASTAR